MSAGKNFSGKQIVAAVAARDQAAKGATGRVLAAFFPEQISVGDLVLQPVTLATYMLLEKINSPLIAKPECSLEDVLRAVIVLSRPVADARALIADPAKFSAAVWELGEKLPVADLKTIGEKIAAHIAAAFDTVIKGEKGGRGLGEHQSRAAASAGLQP